MATDPLDRPHGRRPARQAFGRQESVGREGSAAARPSRRQPAQEISRPQRSSAARASGESRSRELAAPAPAIERLAESQSPKRRSSAPPPASRRRPRPRRRAQKPADPPPAKDDQRRLLAAAQYRSVVAQYRAPGRGRRQGRRGISRAARTGRRQVGLRRRNFGRGGDARQSRRTLLHRPAARLPGAGRALRPIHGAVGRDAATPARRAGAARRRA